MSKKNCILIVDDHIIVSSMLRKIMSDIPVVGASSIAGSASEALAMVNDIRYDLCIVDLELPDMSGIELVERLRESHPDVKIIVVTMHTELWIVNEVIRADVDGMLIKDAEIEEYRKAVTTVLGGGKYFCQRFLSVKNKRDFQDNLLTETETNVLRLLIRGFTTKEIAKQLFRSVNTIDTHRRHIMTKFNAKNIVEIVNKAHAFGYDFGI